MKIKYLLFILLVLIGCATHRNLGSTNLANHYNINKYKFEPKILIAHHNAVESELFFEVNSDELLYAKKENETDFISKVKVSCFIYSGFESKNVIDSVTIAIADTNNNKKSKLIFGSTKFQLAYPANYVAKVKVEDIYRKLAVEKIIRVEKKSYDTRQNFVAIDSLTGHLLFTPYAKLNQTLEIRHFTSNKNQLLVNYYSQQFDLPPPPFSNAVLSKFDFTPDSVFNINLNLNNIGYFKPTKPGMYHIRISGQSQDGFTIFCFQDAFPKIITYTDMIEPLRYICTNKEHQELTLALNKKKVLDELWLKFGGNPENAKLLIKNFYHLVEDANKHFTSYVPGWKTDRGMMYIIFGHPTTVFQTQETETWIYGEENSPLALNLLFVKVDNPFSGNDFRLSRTPIFKNPWYNAVDAWRQGKIINRYD